MPDPAGMGIYVFRNGAFFDKYTGKAMIVPTREKLCAPTVISDIPAYRSPIDGKLITSRSQRREDLKANGCVEYEPSLSPTKGKFRNKQFCAKRGLQVSEEFL